MITYFFYRVDIVSGNLSVSFYTKNENEATDHLSKNPKDLLLKTTSNTVCFFSNAKDGLTSTKTFIY